MNLTEYYTELHRREEAAKSELEKIRNAIRSGQEVCNHDYKHIGNTHKDILECRICRHKTTA